MNLDGDVEMDASIMVGADLRAGAVTVVRDIANPIRYRTPLTKQNLLKYILWNLIKFY